jgi:aspartyl-tRNA(Asn)/glutamyl-tRNA(Gln) amidotransferase subunit A
MPEVATSLHELGAQEAAQLIRERKVSPVELVTALLERASAMDGQVEAWETIAADSALAAAREAEQRAREGDETPLLGVPFGAKDIFDTAGLRTMAGFRPYGQRVPTADAEPVARLKQAGAILLGKLVTTQFAYADPSRTRNPWSADRTPGGSSSGSAAGVAVREVPLALGSQTAGSVLRPAAYTGIIGFKPTYGLVSKRGVLPLAWSLDHVGVLTRSVEDVGVFLSAVAGHDPADPASVVPPTQASEQTLEAPRLGVVLDGLERAVPRVRDHVVDVAQRFEAAGAEVSEVRLNEPLDLILGVHHLIFQTEAAAVHWQLLEQHTGAYAPRLRAYVEVGRLLPATAYLHAQRLRRRIRRQLATLVSGVDALLLPTAVDVAPGRDTTGDPSLQSPFSLVGFPSISLPSGVLEDEHLPLAIQLVAGPWQDQRLLQVAHWCESQLPPMPPPPVGA